MGFLPGLRDSFSSQQSRAIQAKFPLPCLYSRPELHTIRDKWKTTGRTPGNASYSFSLMRLITYPFSLGSPTPQYSPSPRPPRKILKAILFVLPDYSEQICMTAYLVFLDPLTLPQWTSLHQRVLPLQHLVQSERCRAKNFLARGKETQRPAKYVELGRQSVTTRSRDARIVKVSVPIVMILLKSQSRAYHLSKLSKSCH